MPAKSQAQRAAIAIAIAEKHPEKLRPENRGLLSMSKRDMHDFASTPTKKLPLHVPKVASASKSFGAEVPTVGRKKKKYYGE